MVPLFTVKDRRIFHQEYKEKEEISLANVYVCNLFGLKLPNDNKKKKFLVKYCSRDATGIHMTPEAHPVLPSPLVILHCSVSLSLPSHMIRIRLRSQQQRTLCFIHMYCIFLFSRVGIHSHGPIVSNAVLVSLLPFDLSPYLFIFYITG